MATAHLLGQLLPLQSVHLGRLVLNATRPSQDFIDPPSGAHVQQQTSQNVQTNYTETRRFSKSSKVKSYLADIISFSYWKQNECIATLSAPQATMYDLANSAAWFEDACAQAEVRRFLDHAIDNGRKVYLVVGFRTVSDGKLVKDFAASSGKTAAGKTPIYAATGTHIASPGATTGPGVSAVRGQGNGQELAYEAPGEQVFAVLYRKVKFKFLTRKAVDTMVLEANNRWESVWNWRGRNDPAHDGDVQVVEATLTDLDDVDIDDEDDEEDEDEDSDEDSDDDSDGEEQDEDEGQVEKKYQKKPEEHELKSEEEETPRVTTEYPIDIARPKRFRAEFWYLLVWFTFLSGGLAIFWGGFL